MTKDKTRVILFLDENPTPFAELETPIVFDFDTQKLEDGNPPKNTLNMPFATAKNRLCT